MFNIINEKSLTESEKCERIVNLINEDSSAIFEKNLGLTPLHLAVLNNLMEVTKLLLKLGSDINAIEYAGQTALHIAAECNFVEILLWLTHNDKINMDAIDNHGNTALHLSVVAGHKGCVKILVSARRPTDKNIRNKAGLTAADLLKQDNVELKNAFLSTPVTNSLTEQFEKEVFTFYQTGVNNYMAYLKEHLKPLSLSIGMLKERRKSHHRLSDSAGSKLLRTHSLLRRKSSAESSSSTEKAKVSFVQNNTNEEIKNPLQKACLKNDTFAIVNIIKESPNFSIQEFKRVIEKCRNVHTENVLRTVIHELQIISTIRQKELDVQRTGVCKNIHRHLLANGLKENCKIQELTDVSKIEFFKMTDSSYTAEHLRLLTKICSGAIFESHKVTFDLNLVMKQCLGLMDFIQAHEIISHLRQLNPFFSKIQQLQSHYIVITLMQICNSHGDDISNNFVSEQVNLYMNTCCDKEIIDNVTQYKRDFEAFKSKSLDSVIKQIKALTIEDKKESIYSKINETVELSSLDLKQNSILQDNIEYISREFNYITLQFYQSCPLNQFHLKYWDAKYKDVLCAELLEHKEIIDKIMCFVRNVITSYKTPLEQAHAISLFVYVARECLHFQNGSDLVAVMAIASSLEVVDVYCLKETQALLDKETVKIHNGLKKVLDIDDNYKYYRELLLNSPDSLPYTGIYFKDKTFASEQSDLLARVGVSGALTKSLILLKKKVRDVIVVAQSDLLEQLKAQKENMDVLDLLKEEKHSLSREPSPRIELSPPSKEPSPRCESSLKKHSIKRKASSQNAHRLPFFNHDNTLSASSEEKSLKSSHDTNSK